MIAGAIITTILVFLAVSGVLPAVAVATYHVLSTTLGITWKVFEAVDFFVTLCDILSLAFDVLNVIASIFSCIP